MHFRSICLSGGGVAGIAHVGVLQKLHDDHLAAGIDTIVGSSAGAIVGALYAIGMKPRSILDALVAVDRSKIFRFENIDSFLVDYGLDDGKYFMAHIADLYMAEQVDPRITFVEVFRRFKKRLIITGTNTSQHRPEYFSVDATPNMRVLDAVRISMSIPLLFTAVRRENGLFVDGGIRDNYPIEHCLKDFTTRNPLSRTLFTVIGCSLDSLPPKTTPDLESFIFNVFASTVKRSLDEDHTINVYLTDLSSVDFDADAAQLTDAFDKGYEATTLYLASLRKKARTLISRRQSV